MSENRLPDDLDHIQQAATDAHSFVEGMARDDFLADSILLSVIFGLRPPLRPSCLATSSPARVRSTVSSRSISARLAMTWKKKRPDGVPVSMESVRLLNWTPCLCSSPTRSTSCLTERPSRSSFQTTKVSPSRSISSVLAKPGRSARVPLTLSSKTFWHPALAKASRCSSRF